MRCLIIGMVTVTVSACGLHGQAVPENPTATQVADFLEGAKALGQESDLVRFRSCPQEDPARRAILASIRNRALSPNILLELAYVWKDVYGTCDYAPLEAWYLQTFREILGSESADARFGFVDVLPPEIPQAMRERLLDAAEDKNLPEQLRGAYAAKSVSGLPPALELVASLQAFSRDVPGTWIHDHSQRLGRDLGQTFFEALADRAPQLGTEALNYAGNAIANDIRRGIIPADESGLDKLREALRGRPGIRPWSQIPTTRGGVN